MQAEFAAVPTRFPFLGQETAKAELKSHDGWHQRCMRILTISEAFGRGNVSGL
jgi:hypothetical protein